MYRLHLPILALFLAGILSFCSTPKAPAPVVTQETPPQLDITTILTGFDIIWGMDFLPGGDILFGEKRGRLYRHSNGINTEITGFPSVRNTGQGGLLDIRVHPDYATNGWIYASYAATGSSGSGELRVVRFKLSGNTVSGVETIFQSGDGNTWNGHYGSRIAFDKDKMLYLSIGEGGTGSFGGPSASNKNAADVGSNWGKIHRMTDRGAVPADNPVLPGRTAPTTVFAYGVRNPQGMLFHPETGQLWESEHGPKGGDELNIITKGSNYGWPFYSLGVNYNNTTISQGHTAPNITEPVFQWTPSVGTAGMAFITHASFKTWKGNLLVGALASQKLYRCVVDGQKVVSSSEVPGITGRVRHVASAPDGSVYVSIESPGRLVRIRAK